MVSNLQVLPGRELLVRCELADSLLHSYFDSELSRPRATEYERHLQHCVDCAVRLSEQELLRHRLQLAQLYELPPVALKHAIRGDLCLLSSSCAGPQSLLWQWLAVATALVFIALGMTKVSPGGSNHDYQAELADEIVDVHRHSLPLAHRTGIASSNAQVVRQWFDDRLNFALPVRNFANEGFALQGGRMDDVDGRSVAALVYLSSGHLINVFMWPTKEADRSPHTGSVGGYRWIYWRKHKLEFCVVSDAAPGDLERLHHLIVE